MGGVPSHSWVRAGLEVSLASLLLAGALAGLTGSLAMEAAAVAILAIALCHGVLLRQLLRDPSACVLHFWSYGAGTLVMALASGASVALLVRANAARASDWPLLVEVGGLTVLVAAQVGWLYWNLRDLAGPGRRLDVLPPGLAISDPARTSTLLCGVTSVIAAGLALIATLAAWLLQLPAIETFGAMLIALTLSAAAIYFAQETRAVLERREIDPRLLQLLTESIGAAAMKTGAIRRVVEVDAHHGAPGTVIATVYLEFKDGVDARHVAPVLATLHTAAAVAVPTVTALMLGATPQNKD